MAGTGPGVVVKNTFLEVGDHKSLLERHDGWRRQVSEPVKVFAAFNGQAAQDSDFSESDDDVLLGGGMSPAQMESHGAAVSSTHSQKFEASPPMPLNAALNPVVGAQSSVAPLIAAAGSSSSTVGKPPKVLLLSESIPFKRGGGDKDREKRGNRDGHINQMKDISITKKEPPWTSVTTVMMRNLPNKYTQQMLLEELQDGGFRLQQDFDFFYLPMDHSNAANLGYCFINFVETALANAFAAAFQGKKMRRFNSNKTVVVMPASVQGYERNYAYYASTRVVQAEDPQYRPLFLRTAPDGTTTAAAVPPAKPHSKGRGAGKGGKDGSGGKDVGGKGRGGGAGGRASDGSSACETRGRAADWMAPGAGVAPAAWPAAAAQQRLCPACNNECMPTHRFCAFCGTDQMSVHANSASMRADAPTFTPSFSAGGNYSQDGSSNGLGGPLQVPLSGAQQGGQDASSPWNGLSGTTIRSPEVITDELDVMRGRMVLLAALRDMEERESFGGDSARTPGAAASSRIFPQPPSGAGGSLGSREDFLSVLSR